VPVIVAFSDSSRAMRRTSRKIPANKMILIWREPWRVPPFDECGWRRGRGAAGGDRYVEHRGCAVGHLHASGDLAGCAYWCAGADQVYGAGVVCTGSDLELVLRRGAGRD
jgi:hypothetical protein